MPKAKATPEGADTSVPPVDAPAEVLPDEVVLHPYSTVRASNILFDIQIKGEQIFGYFGPRRETVRFDVPDHLLEGFKQHYHCVSGFVVPLAEIPEALQ